MASKTYYQATDKFRELLTDLDGKGAKLATEAGCTPRTIARIKSGKNVNSSTARDVHRASVKALFGYTSDFESAFRRATPPN